MRPKFQDLKIQTLTLNIMLSLLSEVLVGAQAIGEVASPQVPLHLHSFSPCLLAQVRFVPPVTLGVSVKLLPAV